METPGQTFQDLDLIRARPRVLPPQVREEQRKKVLEYEFLPTLPSLLTEPNTPLIHRDVSWLHFNERVLEQARPSSHNLPAERIKFLAISANNLDEFFMVRMASLLRDIAIAKESSPEKTNNIRVRDLILENIAKFHARQSEILELLYDEMASAGIRIVVSADESEAVFEIGRQVFESQVLPHLPAAETFSTSSLTRLKNRQMGLYFSEGLWFRIPRSIPVLLSGKSKDSSTEYFFFLDTLLQTYMARALHSSEAPGLLRVTRDADVTSELVDVGTEPTPSNIRACLKGFDKGRAVRMQYLGNLSPKFLGQAAKALNLDHCQVFPAPTSLCLQGLSAIVAHAESVLEGPSKLLYKPIESHVPSTFLDPKNLFSKIKNRDYLLHHPYDSFDSFLIWIKQACKDSKVKSIDLTVYRSGALSPIMEILKKSARSKTIRIIIELRARFDERNNLKLAEDLSQAGVQVSFGLGKLKLHAKIALVSREEDGVLVHYTHLSTGNYNAKTAKQYTDLGILTANAEIGADAKNFFDTVSKGGLPQGFKQLMLAPTNLHKRLLSLIQDEIRAAAEGKPARIVAKMNALVDPEVIESLYRASQCGVKIDLIVRGACSLIPKVPGLSQNIRVISIIDRFLEHSRLYYFESSKKMYLSSADWMPRNFFRRLEVAFPVLDPRLLKHLTDEVLPTYFADNVKARELTPQGTWKKRGARGKKQVRAQFVFSDMAESKYVGTELV